MGMMHPDMVQTTRTGIDVLSGVFHTVKKRANSSIQSSMSCSAVPDRALMVDDTTFTCVGDWEHVACMVHASRPNDLQTEGSISAAKMMSSQPKDTLVLGSHSNHDGDNSVVMV